MTSADVVIGGGGMVGLSLGLALARGGLTVAVGDDMLERVIETIQKAANTGRIGDGKIFVVDLQQAVRIRTGETGADAL